MTSTWLRGVTGLAALVGSTSFIADASAFCGTCGGGGGVAFAQPMTYQAAYAPAPVAYTANYGSGSGWWPGCCLGRLFGWGATPTYAAYAPTYAVNYAPAVSSCSTCAPCTTCVQQVSMRPVCATSCMPSCGSSDCGTSCASCPGSASYGGTSTVGQAVYQQPDCASCGSAATVVVPPPSAPGMVIQNGASQLSPTPAPTTGAAPPPGLAPGENPAAERSTFETNRPADTNGGVQPGPADENSPPPNGPSNGGSDSDNDATNGDSNANYFEAPRLFNPKDRTAARVAAPIWKAIYEKPVTYHRVSTGPITAAQAEADAAGWSSASK